MTDKYPLISVIIPVFNREQLIQRAINSILNQTYGHLEILIIDDGSTDGVESKIREIADKRIRYYKSKENMGVAFSRNKGIELSAGDVIAFQDSDDESYPERLEKCITILTNSNNDVGAVHCGREIYDSITGNMIGQRIRETDFRDNFTKGAYFLTPGTGTLVIRKEVFSSVGLFDERLRTFEDTEFAIRVSQKYKYAFINEALIKVYRNHDQLRGNKTEPVLAREIIYDKHKSFLSPPILYGLCKAIANNYIMTDNYAKAKIYIKESFKYKFEIKTLIQFLMINSSPSFIKAYYNKKYSKEIPSGSSIQNIIPELHETQ